MLEQNATVAQEAYGSVCRQSLQSLSQFEHIEFTEQRKNSSSRDFEKQYFRFFWADQWSNMSTGNKHLIEKNVWKFSIIISQVRRTLHKLTFLAWVPLLFIKIKNNCFQSSFSGD